MSSKSPRPEYLRAGEVARIFPVLATTSKEGRTTSIVLACLRLIEPLARDMLGSIGVRVGVRSEIETYTEISFHGLETKDRPDGLIIHRNGRNEWRALIETKVGNTDLQDEQVERYRRIAKDQRIDAVITISNAFTAAPGNHPLESVRKSRSAIPVYHWSWMAILTSVDMLLGNEDVADREQRVLLNELLRFLTHDSAGVRGFDRMPPEWASLGKSIREGGHVRASSAEALSVVAAWHQETRDLALILSRLTGRVVKERLPRSIQKDPSSRRKSDAQSLAATCQLSCSLIVPDTAGDLQVTMDFRTRTISVEMSLNAPGDKKSNKARLNWLLRQLSKLERPEQVIVRANWPGRSASTQHSLDKLRQQPELIEDGKGDQTLNSFSVLMVKECGGRFVQLSNIIEDLEKLIPDFYHIVGQNLSAWQSPAPRAREPREDIEDVAVGTIADEAEDRIDRF